MAIGVYGGVVRYYAGAILYGMAAMIAFCLIIGFIFNYFLFSVYHPLMSLNIIIIAILIISGYYTVKYLQYYQLKKKLDQRLDNTHLDDETIKKCTKLNKKQKEALCKFYNIPSTKIEDIVVNLLDFYTEKHLLEIINLLMKKNLHPDDSLFTFAKTIPSKKPLPEKIDKKLKKCPKCNMAVSRIVKKCPYCNYEFKYVK